MIRRNREMYFNVQQICPMSIENYDEDYFIGIFSMTISMKNCSKFFRPHLVLLNEFTPLDDHPEYSHRMFFLNNRIVLFKYGVSDQFHRWNVLSVDGTTRLICLKNDQTFDISFKRSERSLTTIDVYPLDQFIY